MQNWSAILALGTLLAAGACYRLVAAMHAGNTPFDSLPAGTLDRLPWVLGEWGGQDAPVEEQIIRAADADAHLSRQYGRPGRGGSIHLWVSYGVRLRDLAPHRPEVCYPSAGWTLQQSQRVESFGRTFALSRFQRGGFAPQGVSVLHWYVVDGQHAPDLSLLRSKAWRAPARSDYVLSVQLSTATTEDGGSLSDANLLSFAALVAPEIHRLVTGAGATDSSAPRTSAPRTGP